MKGELVISGKISELIHHTATFDADSRRDPAHSRISRDPVRSGKLGKPYPQGTKSVQSAMASQNPMLIEVSVVHRPEGAHPALQMPIRSLD
jgi:hypothetical protein